MAWWSSGGCRPQGCGTTHRPRPMPQSAAGEDVLLHRSYHGHCPGHLHPAHQPWQGNRGCEAGMGLPQKLGAEGAWALQGAAGVGPEAHCVRLQAILLLVPAFLLIGCGLTLPTLGLGLLLYSFGEWPARAPGGDVAGRPSGHQPTTLSSGLTGASLMSPQPLPSWCPACPLWSPAMVRGPSLDRGRLRWAAGRHLMVSPLPLRLAWAEGHGHGHAAEPGRPRQGAGAHGGRLR